MDLDKKKKKENKKNDASDVDLATSNIVDVQGTDFQILIDQPYLEYESVGTKAFKAKHVKTGKIYLALLTGHEAIPRFKYMTSLMNFRVSGLLSFYDSGLVYLPIDKMRYVACIFDIPQGKKVMNEQNGSLQFRIPSGYPHKLLNSNIIGPFLKVMRNLRSIEMVHGAVNLNNLYFIEMKDKLQLQLGECITSPHSYSQHVIFETIDRAIADPASRGISSEKDDLYSFGVCLALMVIGKNPFKNMSIDQIIKQKIEVGTYMSIARSNPLPSGVSEFLRGVLNDEYSSRWSLDEAVKWFDGSHMTIKTPRPAYKAARPYAFANETYSYIGSLVNGFVKNPDAAVQSLKEKEFREWLHRNITDKGVIVNFDKNFGVDKDVSETYENHDDLMLVHACIALDSSAPIRYNHLSVLPKGLGIGMAHAVMTGKDVNPYLDILKKRIVDYWFDMQHVHLSDFGSLGMDQEKARNYLKQKMTGRGFERALYILCPETHCLSPTIKDYYVLDGVSFLDAFERLAKKNQLPNINNFFDRHMMAFLLEHDPSVIEPNLSMIISTSKQHKIIGLLRGFSSMQKKSLDYSAPSLFKWFVENIEPAIEQVHDRKLRNSLLIKVKKLSSKKTLYNLLEIVDNGDMLRIDTHGFVLAKNEYRSLEMRKRILKGRLLKKEEIGLNGGRQVAMVVSVVLSIISIGVMMFVKLGS